MANKDKQYFAALYQVAKVINASLDPSQVLEQIVAAVAETMKVKAACLRILGAQRKRLFMGACAGLSQAYLRKGPVLVNESGIDKRALKGEAVYLADAGTDPNFQYGQRAKEEGIRSVLAVPLVVGKKAIGVLRVYTATKRQFSEDEVRFLEVVASLSAIALDNARLHQALKKDFDLLIANEFRLDDN
ncbi:MAG: GAF domain-containing protein [Thermodesulfobacteriota bacterium]